MKVVSWFSCGVSSAIATKLAIENNGCKDVYYIHIADEHKDNARFIADCEKWFGIKIQTLQSQRFKSVDDVLQLGYINGVGGASCTKRLKRDVRKEWERTQDISQLCYVWGLDISEKHRMDRINNATEIKNMYPLIERNISKENAHGMLKSAGIKRPVMYELGYNNNNCIGCVKGGKGYWNKIRKDFPEVFKSRAMREREVGHSCINGTYLDELAEGTGRIKEVLEDCGIFCEIK